MMTSFDYNYQNALREAIVFSIFSFVKNHSCVTHLHDKDCSKMHSGSCNQMMSSCRCPISMYLFIDVSSSVLLSSLFLVWTFLSPSLYCTYGWMY